jgi:hypothetical protein
MSPSPYLTCDEAAVRGVVRAEALRADRGFVYFVRCRDCGLVKIGFANDVSARIRAVVCPAGCATGVKLLGTLPGGMGQERHLHARYDPYNVECSQTEWFALSEEQVDDAAALCARHGWPAP